MTAPRTWWVVLGFVFSASVRPSRTRGLIWLLGCCFGPFGFVCPDVRFWLFSEDWLPFWLSFSRLFLFFWLASAKHSSLSLLSTLLSDLIRVSSYTMRS